MASVISSADFLRLVDAVLLAVGRDALIPGSPQQRIITVDPNDRVLQILAGPGSGKTEMLVWRVLHELLVIGTPSQRVMVTTFTRRAATELQVRVVERSDLLLKKAADAGLKIDDPKVHDLRIGTIHSLCDSLLAEFDTQHADSGTQVVDDAEISVRIARDHRFALGYNGAGGPKRVLNRLLENVALTHLFRAPWDDSPNWPASTMDRVGCIAAILGQQIETWVPRCGATMKQNGIEKVHGPRGLTDDLIKLQNRWEDYLSKNDILDFATIQKRLLDRQSVIVDHLTHVFVDEFQDNNPIQFAIHTGWLSKPNVRLTVVGDDDQAIYRFRGSDIECFNQLEPFCKAAGLSFRVELLEVNHRSTCTIVNFCQAFKGATVLKQLSMPKTITAAPKAPGGDPVRLLQGSWSDLCLCVAEELRQIGAGLLPETGKPPPPSAAILIFSTNERSSRTRTAAALELRSAIEARGLRVYNPRNKMAASPESPVAQLLGLVSYLIDPVTFAPAGSNGRQVMVAASMGDANKQQFARTSRPSFAVSPAHLEFQKKFVKGDGGDIGTPSASRKPVLDLVDSIRGKLVAATAAGKKPRLSLAGFVARLLSLPFFRNCGFTPTLFREALFTELLEANVAPTRRTYSSLDGPLEVTLANQKYVWDDRYWSFLNVIGPYLANASLDDPEVETFEEDAVLMITFHQGKGLEFDHVYVAGTGRAPDIAPALRTKLFSGEAPRYSVAGNLSTKDTAVLSLALADREREVYVAMTRAKKSLTILHDPSDTFAYMPLNEGLASLFTKSKAKAHPTAKRATVKEWK